MISVLIRRASDNQLEYAISVLGETLHGFLSREGFVSANGYSLIWEWLPNESDTLILSSPHGQHIQLQDLRMIFSGEDMPWRLIQVDENFHLVSSES